MYVVMSAVLACVVVTQAAVPANPDPTPPGAKVGFSARRATGNLQATTKLRFEDVLTNIGDGFNERTGEFVAPYHGGYYFSFHAVSTDGGDFTLALMRVATFADYEVTAYGAKGSYNSGSNSVFLTMHRGETVYLELQSGSIYEHPGNEAYTTFSGFMVFGL